MVHEPIIQYLKAGTGVRQIKQYSLLLLTLIILTTDPEMLQQRSISTPTSAYNTNSTNQQHNRSESFCDKLVQLQVNISIGKNKFLLRVQKCSNLHNEVQRFLKNHNINLKYEGIILSMVRQQLAKKQKIKEIRAVTPNKQRTENEQQRQLVQLKHIKSQIDNKKKMMYEIQRKQSCQQKKQAQQLWENKQDKPKSVKTSGLNISRQNKQNQLSHYNSKCNHRLSTQAPNQSKDQVTGNQNAKSPRQMTEQEVKSQNIYEKWKIKQKIKEKQKTKNVSLVSNNKSTKQKVFDRSFVKQKSQKDKQKVESKSKSHKKIEVHSPDYFYSKGLKFKQVKQGHIQQMYKQKYPFQINRDSSITPSKKTELHDRLYKEYKVKVESQNEKKLQQIILQRQKSVKTTAHVNVSIDKYKKKVTQRNNKLNEALNYLIENKMIQNPYKIEKVSKSPFRNG